MTSIPSISMASTQATINEATNYENYPELRKVRATFKPESTLYNFFMFNGFLLNLRFNIEKRNYFLFNIFGIVAMFISHFQSFDLKNPYIIVCSPGLRFALKVDVCFVQDLPAYIMRQLIFDMKDYDVLNKYFETYVLNPIWIKGYITDFIRPLNDNIKQTTTCKVNNKFLKFLRFCDEKSYRLRTKLTFEEICTTVANYVCPKMEPFYFSRFYISTQVHKIKGTKLEPIFNVDYCSGTQCKMLIMTQIKKYTNQPIPESRYEKAMRLEMTYHHDIVNSILQAASDVNDEKVTD